MPTYTCPECDSKLKTKATVAPGKKLRCPECDFVFAPPREKVAAAPPKPKPKSHSDGGDSGENYALITEAVNKEADETRRASFDPIKERFKKSKRGPAMGLIVKPSDWLLRVGIGTCFAAIVGIALQIWPMIFRIEETQQPKPGQKFVPYSEQKVKYKTLSREEYVERFVWVGMLVLQFAWGATICTGASKMHNLEWYPMAMAAACMAMVGPFVPLGYYLIMDYLNDKNPDVYQLVFSLIFLSIPGVPMSIWCIHTLRKEAVRDGFAEDKPDLY